jgi:hypothetical protein
MNSSGGVALNRYSQRGYAQTLVTRQIIYLDLAASPPHAATTHPDFGPSGRCTHPCSSSILR